MEAGDPISRQSGHLSASASTTSERPSLQPQQSPFQPSRDPPSARSRDPSTMASASVLPTGSSYQSTFTNSRPATGGPNISQLMSSNDAGRKPSEDNDSVRQSLPSISEVISATKPQFPPSSSSLPPSSSLPSPFPSASRAYTESDPRASPHPPPFPARQENMGSFSGSPRPAPYSARPGLHPIPERRPSPHRPDGQAHSVNDPHSHNGVYAHHSHPPPPPPPPPLSMGYQQNGHLPAGQVPLPGYTASTRHPPPPPPPGHYDSRTGHPEDVDLSARQRYDATVNRHFENWGYTDTLTRIVASSRTVFNFAEAWGHAASDANPTQPQSTRMPSDREVADMLANVELMKQSLEQVRDMAQASLRKERAIAGANAKMGGYEDQDDVSMCPDGMKSQYPLVEVKKRRGRAAPPGRCHSCNRIDTPEWRRGPDGARTLCNACGLHYAKLERKRQLEARSIRPKPEERGS